MATSCPDSQQYCLGEAPRPPCVDHSPSSVLCLPVGGCHLISVLDLVQVPRTQQPTEMMYRFRGNAREVSLARQPLLQASSRHGKLRQMHLRQQSGYAIDRHHRIQRCCYPRHQGQPCSRSGAALQPPNNAQDAFRHSRPGKEQSCWRAAPGSSLEQRVHACLGEEEAPEDTCTLMAHTPSTVPKSHFMAWLAATTCQHVRSLCRIRAWRAVRLRPERAAVSAPAPCCRRS